jgi:hypothetical protein
MYTYTSDTLLEAAARNGSMKAKTLINPSIVNMIFHFILSKHIRTEILRTLKKYFIVIFAQRLEAFLAQFPYFETTKVSL